MSKHIDILQIGAHIGNSLNDPLYNTCLNNKSLILIEPVPFLFDILVHNYKVKCKTENINVECLNIAVSDKDGFIDMYAPSNKCNLSILPYWISQLGSMTDEHFHNHNIDFVVHKSYKSILIVHNCELMILILMIYHNIHFHHKYQCLLIQKAI